MSKTSNSILFILLATVINIVLIMGIFILCIFLGSHIFDLNNAEGNAGVIVLGASFVIALGGTLFIYSKLVKVITEKFKLDEKLSPIFRSKKKR
jgi:predicted permease